MTILSIIDGLKSQSSFCKFEQNMLPPEVSLEELLSILAFLSPQIVIEHGSYVTNTRYSPESERDLDLIIATFKRSFWHTDYLYEKALNKLKANIPNTKFDITLISPYDLITIIKERTSLGESLIIGFTIVYPEKIDEIS